MNIYPKVNYNGLIIDATSVPFPYDDYGFLYGYGLFETVRVYNNSPIMLDRHWKRLETSAIILGIDLPLDYVGLVTIVDTLIAANPVSPDCVINIYLTAGDRPVGTSKIIIRNPMVLVVARPNSLPKTNVGLYLGIRQESFQRSHLDQFKMMAYIKNILEKALCDPYDDVLLYTANRDILETPTANVFFVKDGTLYTPKSDHILPGVTRGFLIESSEEFGMKCVIEDIKLDTLSTFSELFLTSSLRGIVRIDKLERYSELKSGPITQMIQRLYNELLGLPNLPDSTKTYGPT